MKYVYNNIAKHWQRESIIGKHRFNMGLTEIMSISLNMGEHKVHIMYKVTRQTCMNRKYMLNISLGEQKICIK